MTGSPGSLPAMPRISRAIRRVLTRAVAPLAVGALVTATTACSSTTPAATSTTTTTGSSTAGRAPGGAGTTSGSTATTVGHVFVINLENESYAQTWGADSPATYLNSTLVPKGTLLTQYFGIGHASLPNYLAQISGQAPSPATQLDCLELTEFVSTGTAELGQEKGDGCVYPASVKTVADQLDAKGLTWKGYMEDMASGADQPEACRHPEIGGPDDTHSARKGDQYAVRHNPFMYFHSIIDSPACAQRVVDLAALDADLEEAATTPNLAYITPNLCHDGHDEPCVDGQPGGLTSADEFLRTWVPKITDSPAFRHDGLLVITFDEAELFGDHADATACCNEVAGPNAAAPGLSGPGGGRIGALVLSPLVKAGESNETPMNHYGLLATIESIFGLDQLGMAAQPGLTYFTVTGPGQLTFVANAA